MTTGKNTEVVPFQFDIQFVEGQQMVSARELHALLGVGRDFATWIKDRIDKYGFQEGDDYSPNLVNNTGERGQPRIEYLITLDMAKELGMIENNSQGRTIRRYFIQVEKKAKKLYAERMKEPMYGSYQFRNHSIRTVTIDGQVWSCIRDVKHSSSQPTHV